MNKGTIIFDFDGTIADSFEVVLRIFYELTGKPPFTDEQIAEYRKLPLKRIGKKIGISLSQVSVLLIKGRTMMIHRMREVKPIHGMQDALKDLQEMGWQLMVISSNSHQNVEEYLKVHKLDAYFDRVYGGVGLFGKSNALRKVIKQNKLDRSTCFYVGDESRDMQAARKTRIGSVGVSWGFNDVSLLKSEKPTAIADSPVGLVAIFADK